MRGGFPGWRNRDWVPVPCSTGVLVVTVVVNFGLTLIWATFCGQQVAERAVFGWAMAGTIAEKEKS